MEEINRRCADHVTKQDWAVLSTTYRTQDKATGVGKLLVERSRAALGSEERKAADEAVRKLDETKFKRAKHDRHQQRMQALYVDPDESGTGWNRPRISVGKKTAYEFLIDAGNDYAIALQKIDPGLLKGRDDGLLKELTEWSDRPTVPAPERLLPQASNRLRFIVGVGVVIVAAASAIITLLR